MMVIIAVVIIMKIAVRMVVIIGTTVIKYDIITIVAIAIIATES